MPAAARAAMVLRPQWHGAPGWLLLPLPGGEATAAELVERAVDAADLLDGAPVPANLALVAGEWQLGVRELRALVDRLAARGIRLTALWSADPRSRVAAAAVGLQSSSPGPEDQASRSEPSPREPSSQKLCLQRGTLRSGDHLEAEGSVLVLGDVNPGARVSAGGHVLVWGRLRGIAHAGCHGDARARIVALQLRPLQLRIAGAVARGPDDSPAAGMAEQASLVDGTIRLDPAPPIWPLERTPDSPAYSGLEPVGRRFGPNLPRPQAQP